MMSAQCNPALVSGGPIFSERQVSQTSRDTAGDDALQRGRNQPSSAHSAPTDANGAKSDTRIIRQWWERLFEDDVFRTRKGKALWIACVVIGVLLIIAFSLAGIAYVYQTIFV